MLQVHYFTFNPFSQNTYILFNENNNAIIIDPGNYDADEDNQLNSFISTHQLTVQQLINTHCHIDHIFGLQNIYTTYKTPLVIHKNEEPMLQLAPQIATKYGVDYNSYTGTINFVNDGDIIKLDHDELQVITAAGHSPGHICFYNKAEHFLIAGDVLFYESIGRTDLPMCNHDDLIKNIKEKIFTLPDNTKVYSGHGISTTIEHEKLYNPFVN